MVKKDQGNDVNSKKLEPQSFSEARLFKILEERTRLLAMEDPDKVIHINERRGF
ncbi:hypothetical protein PT285_02075 [Lactobacillus sp. ESL0791]|uniref:hypothetical protein n=1 Tax=Lactobacillus sp. ESL0791 TaxID=2983234 RepID=UPI0023F986B8|nr:hypothetical protein [Lactobacillus sp. ESL0791]MDF7638225.1 hypothetical protein [Lactobacillus sp. ESL0791]